MAVLCLVPGSVITVLPGHATALAQYSPDAIYSTFIWSVYLGPFHGPFNSASMLVLLKCFPGSTSRCWKICTGKQHVSLFSTLSSCFLLSLFYVAFLFSSFCSFFTSPSPHPLSRLFLFFFETEAFLFCSDWSTDYA